MLQRNRSSELFVPHFKRKYIETVTNCLCVPCYATHVDCSLSEFRSHCVTFIGHWQEFVDLLHLLNFVA